MSSESQLTARSETTIALPSASGYRTRTALIIVTILWALIYLPGMFRPGLLDDADSVHAEAAREMLVRHDWVTLHANGIRYLEKAPLMYWTIAASFETFGVREWSARLPVVLGILALAFSCYWIARRVYGDYGGFAAALAITTCVGPFIFTRFLIPDMLVALWLTLSMGFFLVSLEEERPSRWSCWGFAVACALNVLTKGLIGVVFPIGIVVAYLLLTRDLKRLLRMHLVSSTLLFLAIAAPWHILAGLANPTVGNVRGFFWFYFINEHFLRYLNKRVPRDYDTVPIGYFWGLMLVWLLPWSAFVLQSLGRVPRWREWNSRMSPRQRANLLCALWAAIVLVFFSFSTRQEYYVLPALPALALLVGGWLGEEDSSAEASRVRRWSNVGAYALGGIFFVAGVSALALYFVTPQPAPGSDLAQVLRSNPQAYALSFGHIQDLTLSAMAFFHGPLLLLGYAMLVAAVFLWLLRRREWNREANLVLACAMVPVLLAAQLGFITFYPILGSKDLAKAIEQEYKPGDVVEINGEYESGSTLNFYLRHEVRILNGRSSNLWYGSFFPDAPKIFDDDRSFAELWQSPKRVYLFTEEGKVPAVALRGRLVASSGGKVVLANR